MARASGIGGVVVAALFGMCLHAGAAVAHEFWIEAEDYRIVAGEPVVANLRVGQNFRGSRIGFLPDRFRRFDIVGPSGPIAVTSRLGDAPAVDQALKEAGAHTIVHVTTESTLTYDAFDDFAAFAAAHGLDERIAEHVARGLPDADFREAYSRSVKALIQVGPTDGDAARDTALGLPIEIVVEDDPYAEPLPQAVRVQAFYDGQPIPNALISVFSKSPSDGELAADQIDMRADTEGRASVPITSGRRYLLNVVVLREPSAELAAREDVVWESLWGSTTFETD